MSDHQRYEKSFEVLESVQPDAKYYFKAGILFSSVTERDILPLSAKGSKLRECGWTIYNEFWVIIY